MSDVRYLLNDEAVCPYCNYEGSDSWEIESDKTDEWVQVECGNCLKIFLMERVVSTKYTTERADCANGDADHKWKNRVSAPRKYAVGRQSCEVCFSDREIDPEEWEKIDADHNHPQNWRNHED